jgi:hypothetical protein
MRKVAAPLLALVAAVVFSMSPASGDPQAALTQIEPSSDLAQQAIRVALDEFKKHLFNTDGYRTTVVQAHSSIWVIFQDPDLPAGWRGSSDTKLGFEVELSQDATRVIKSHFIR